MIDFRVDPQLTSVPSFSFLEASVVDPVPYGSVSFGQIKMKRIHNTARGNDIGYLMGKLDIR